MKSAITGAMVALLVAACAWQSSGFVFADEYDIPFRPNGGGFMELGDYAKDDEVSADCPLSSNAIDLIWEMIDENRDGLATDREVYASRGDLRRFANASDRTEYPEIRDALVEHYDADADGILNQPEALLCLSTVRGVRCPTAARAKAYWISIDSDNDGAVEPSEFHALLRPLGRVGRAMAGILDGTLDSIDENDNDRVEEIEVYRRANAMLLIKLATEGDNIRGRDPADWLRYVFAVAELDRDADNIISPNESLAVNELARNFRSVDKNRDRSVTVSELCDFKDRVDAAVAREIARARAAARARSFSSGSC